MKRICVLLILFGFFVFADDVKDVERDFDEAVRVERVSVETSRTDPEVFAVPLRLNYQGFLTDDDGNAIDDTATIVFKIFTASAGGSELWSSGNQLLDVVDGVFHLVLASVPLSVFEAGDARWLELTVRGEVLSPRTEVTSVAWSYVATLADSADGANRIGGQTLTALDARYINNGESAGNDLSGTYPNPTVARIQTRPISTTAPTIGQILKWDGSQWVPSNDTAGGADNDWIITDTNMYAGVSGNIGIGTGEPQAKLEVNGVICGGSSHTIYATYGAVLGGQFNTVGHPGADDAAVVCGGSSNTAAGSYGAVLGGYNNTAGSGLFDSASVVCGGHHNSTGLFSAICGGQYNNAFEFGTVGGGTSNNAAGKYATIAGGYANTGMGSYSTVGGGRDNWSDSCASVGGGVGNFAGSPLATIGGGSGNITSNIGVTIGGGMGNVAGGYAGTVGGGRENGAGPYSFVGGGWHNSAADSHTTIGGGDNNQAQGHISTIGGGWGNHTSGYSNTISGGGSNTTGPGSFVSIGGGFGNGGSGSYSTVGGGSNNSTDANYAFVGGGRDNAAHASYATIGGGWQNHATGVSATVGGGYLNAADSLGTTVAGGQYNTASYTYATVGGGSSNTASAIYTTVSGGRNNVASYSDAAIGGGSSNSASANYATVGGGYSNNASASSATIGGGFDNTASSVYATVCGGMYNAASNNYTTLAGGRYNTASGIYGAVAGGYADTSAAMYSLTAGNHSIVPSVYSNSVAFNGQTATASSQTRVGTLSKASGTFTIDHPLDPMNKILNHYFVESPEMVLIYRGIAVIGAGGRAEVQLPDYYDALNKNSQIQLTGIGTYEVYVAEKVRDNRFVIGGKPGTEVHWVVTGERQDPSAEITKIIMPVEQPKDGDLAGRSLDDDFLCSTREQLERMGRAAEFKFRLVSNQQRYEEMRRISQEGR